MSQNFSITNPFQPLCSRSALLMSIPVCQRCANGTCCCYGVGRINGDSPKRQHQVERNPGFRGYESAVVWEEAVSGGRAQFQVSHAARRALTSLRLSHRHRATWTRCCSTWPALISSSSPWRAPCPSYGNRVGDCSPGLVLRCLGWVSLACSKNVRAWGER